MSDNISEMEWRPCVKFPDYEISDCGELRRAAHVANQPGRKLRGCIDADGYIRYAVRDSAGVKRTAFSHRLVAEAFLGPAPDVGMQVAHVNGSRILNTPSNLRWATCAENLGDRVVHGTDPIGARNPKAKLTDDDVRYIRRRYREIKLQRGDVAELDRRFSMCRSQIIRVARRQAWAHVD